MKIGYARVSKADSSQLVDLQVDALVEAGVVEENVYTDEVSGKKDDRPGLEACLKALRKGDMLVIWKLDQLGRNLQHLVNVVQELADIKNSSNNSCCKKRKLVFYGRGRYPYQRSQM